MRRIFYLLFVVSAAFLVTSCQKEVSVDSGSGGSGGSGGNAGGNGGGSTSGLKGDWKFISQDAELKSTVQYSLFGSVIKSITSTNYTTLDTKGALQIGDPKLPLAGMSYRVATTSYVELYEDNDLTDTLSMPFEYTMPEYNSAGDYKFVGSDSIYFTGTSFSFVQGTSMPSGP